MFDPFAPALRRGVFVIRPLVPSATSRPSSRPPLSARRSHGCISGGFNCPALSCSFPGLAEHHGMSDALLYRRLYLRRHCPDQDPAGYQQITMMREEARRFDRTAPAHITPWAPTDRWLTPAVTHKHHHRRISPTPALRGATNQRLPLSTRARFIRGPPPRRSPMPLPQFSPPPSPSRKPDQGAPATSSGSAANRPGRRRPASH